MGTSILVKFGGLEVRSAEMVAPAAFLDSVSSTFGLVQQLLPFRMKDCLYPAFDDGMDVWTQGIVDSPPTDAAACKQQA